jgi:hypothetical protein
MQPEPGGVQGKLFAGASEAMEQAQAPAEQQPDYEKRLVQAQLDKLMTNPTGFNSPVVQARIKELQGRLDNMSRGSGSGADRVTDLQRKLQWGEDNQVMLSKRVSDLLADGSIDQATHDDWMAAIETGAGWDTNQQMIRRGFRGASLRGTIPAEVQKEQTLRPERVQTSYETSSASERAKTEAIPGQVRAKVESESLATLGAPKELSPKHYDGLQGINDFIAGVKAIEEFMKANPNLTGPAAGRAGNLAMALGTASPERSTFSSLKYAVSNAAIKAQSGAQVNAQELQRIEKQIGSENLTPEAYLASLRANLARLRDQKDRQIEYLKGLNYQLGPLEADPAPLDPSKLGGKSGIRGQAKPPKAARKIGEFTVEEE